MHYDTFEQENTINSDTQPRRDSFVRIVLVLRKLEQCLKLTVSDKHNA